MLPTWNGASACYSRAQRLLARWGENAPGGTTMPVSGFARRIRRKKRQQSRIVCTPDMGELIEALNDGDEETIKGLLFLHDAVGKVG